MVLMFSLVLRISSKSDAPPKTRENMLQPIRGRTATGPQAALAVLGFSTKTLPRCILRTSIPSDEQSYKTVLSCRYT